MKLKFKEFDWLKGAEKISSTLMNFLFGVLCGLSWLGAMHYFSVVAGYPEITALMLKIVGWMFMLCAVYIVFGGLRKIRDKKLIKDFHGLIKRNHALRTWIKKNDSDEVKKK